VAKKCKTAGRSLPPAARRFAALRRRKGKVALSARSRMQRRVQRSVGNVARETKSARKGYHPSHVNGRSRNRKK